MAGCFDFRMRASSFDMHQLAQSRKLAKFTKLFRSRSDSNVKSSPVSSPLVSPKGSPRISPTNSPGGQPRRRFVRVVRDAEREGEEYENPHIIRRFTQGYVEEKYVPMQKWNSMEDPISLPYDPQEDSILKKGLSVDTTLDVSEGSNGEKSPPASEKHASFSEEVEIIEYDKKGKIQKCVCLTHREKLHDDSDSDFLEDLPEESEKTENKENTQPTEDACPEDSEKSLKDSNLQDIVNAEKAVNRKEAAEQQPIKTTKRQGDVNCTHSLKSRKEEDQTLADSAPEPPKADEAVVASRITKVCIDCSLESDQPMPSPDKDDALIKL